MFNLGDGAIYASADNGSIYRVDPDNAAAEYLGTPIRDRPSRLTKLVMHHDGYAYGITGRGGACRLLRFDPARSAWTLGPDVKDADGAPMWQCHDLALTPEGTIFAGENDHPRRSGYLWN